MRASSDPHLKEMIEMTDALTIVNTRKTAQTDKARPEQVANSAGGFVFQVSDFTLLRRFLTIGTTGGTFYVGQEDLTKKTAGAVLDLIGKDGLGVVREVVDISLAGRAPKQNPGLFVLAACAGVGDDETRKFALSVLPQVARTASALFTFVKYVEQFRGWGKGLRKAVGRWYAEKDVDALAYQMLKYQGRDGWTHGDLLRLAHPGGKESLSTLADDGHAALYQYATLGKGENWREITHLPALVDHVHQAHDEPHMIPTLIAAAGGALSWEMLPSASLNTPAVWEALLSQGLPTGALLRQLPRLTRLGLCDPMSETGAQIAAQLTDADKLKKARIHPFQVLVAQKTYASGQSEKGSSTWTPSRLIVDALDTSFYAAFGAVEPAGKRTLLALDVSGSMQSRAAGLPMSCREVSAALALVTASTEELYGIVGFTSGNGGNRGRNAELTELAISPRQRLDDVNRTISNLPFGATDCSLPMTWALHRKLAVDTFCVYTDNETWAGNIHPFQALEQYRQATGIPAKLVVVALTATEFSIANPKDPGMLDVSGFDAATPKFISDFSAGRV